MKPLLAHTYEPHRFAPGYVQPKLNGVRALYQYGDFQSRDELPWNKTVLWHLWVPLMQIFDDPRIILDGELYVHGWSLQRINGAVQIARSEPRGDTHLVEYHVFDRVSYSLPFIERFERVREATALLRDTNIKIVPTYKVETPEQANDYYTKLVGDGYEGMMYRLGDCPYTEPKQLWSSISGTFVTKLPVKGPLKITQFASDKNNRCWHLLKRKDWQDGEFECVRIEEGVGKRQGMVGAFVCRTPVKLEGGSLIGGRATWIEFNVGSGLTDAEATYYFNNPDQVIGHKIKVKFLTYTADGKPFNPTVEAIL